MATVVPASPSVSVVPVLELELEPYPPIAEEVIDGVMDMHARLLWVSPDRRAATGVWRCDPVTLHLEHPFDETFVVLEGRLTVTPDDGEPTGMGPSDAIVLSRGSRNTWEIHETVTKVFSVHQAGPLPWAASASP